MADFEKSAPLGRRGESPSSQVSERRHDDSLINRIPPSKVLAMNEKDIDENLELDKEDDGLPSPSNTSMGSADGTSRTVLSFEENDPDQPNNWSAGKKSYVLFAAICTVMNSTMSSSLAAGNSKQLSDYFNVTNEEQLVLPTSIFLVGYTCGPLIFGPLSESYGRKWTMVWGFLGFTLASMASALAPTWAALNVFRLFVGIFGACPIAVVGGICADIYHHPQARGRAMAVFMAATTFGPVLGPPISGFLAPVSWRWSFWIGLLLTVGAWPFLLTMPETYASTILKHRAARIRKETGDSNVFAPIELEKTNIHHVVTVVLTRPVRMFCFEPLVLFTCLYLSYAYAIFYIFFQSYPIIFTGIYGMNAGEEGLTFLPIGIGALIAAGIYLAWDNILARAQKLDKPWSRSEEMRRLPLACLAGPFFALSMFWAGWTAKKDVHWIVPCLAGIPFGIGYLCLFMALLNYLVDAYEIFAASAMAAASTCRSTFGAVLPFAARPMYRSLGVPWACSLLGFLSVLMCAIPLLFLRFGTALRARSEFCQYLAKRKVEEAEKRERERGPEVREGDLEVAGGGTEEVVAKEG